MYKRLCELPIISIHAPRVGSDPAGRSPSTREMKFQSTLPVWGATGRIGSPFPIWTYFNPRSPCGERLSDNNLTDALVEFQSTLPVWGATYNWSGYWRAPAISIHAPRVGSDCRSKAHHCLGNYFNPRSPCGERPASPPLQRPSWGISIHAPRVGSDLLFC